MTTQIHCDTLTRGQKNNHRDPTSMAALLHIQTRSSLEVPLRRRLARSLVGFQSLATRGTRILGAALPRPLTDDSETQSKMTAHRNLDNQTDMLHGEQTKKQA